MLSLRLGVEITLQLASTQNSFGQLLCLVFGLLDCFDLELQLLNCRR